MTLGGVVARRDRLIRDMLRDRFVVTMHAGETFEGLLLDADDRTVQLADPVSIAANGDRLKVDGQLWLPREQIAYMQRPA